MRCGLGSLRTGLEWSPLQESGTEVAGKKNVFATRPSYGRQI